MAEQRSNIMRLPPSGYRLHRFPPLAQPVAVDEEFGLDNQGWQESQVDIQQQLEAGFQQGLQQGHEEGLRQGIEQGKQQGLLDGQKEGFQKGFVSGEQAGKQGFLEAAKPVNDLFQALSRWQSEKEQQQRHMICELVQKVAQQVIRAELTLMPQQILALVDETLSAMPGKAETVTVHLNPQDLERITHINADLPKSWKLVANNELPIGGCQLVTDDAEADASCDSRLEACMDNVKQHLLDEVSISQVESENE
ncbi:flagellar assembly protein FliH [Vibrio parahaemolyticus]|nr:flagellar assembly protein H [Vibrio parahaemolyticus]